MSVPKQQTWKPPAPLFSFSDKCTHNSKASPQQAGTVVSGTLSNLSYLGDSQRTDCFMPQQKFSWLCKQFTVPGATEMIEQKQLCCVWEGCSLEISLLRSLLMGLCLSLPHGASSSTYRSLGFSLPHRVSTSMYGSIGPSLPRIWWVRFFFLGIPITKSQTLNHHQPSCLMCTFHSK